jgi:cytochrome c peroxidase
MDHYNKGGETNPYLDGGIEPLNLSEDEINDVVAFLFTLTDQRFAEAERGRVPGAAGPGRQATAVPR